MSRTSFLILLGVLTILTPLSGLPITLRSVLIIFFGICVLSVGFSLRAPHNVPPPELPQA